MQQIQHAITIEAVAARAGVSPGTVSRVLNGKNKENRPAIARRSENIRRIATEMGYRPNAAARSVLRGRFNAVGFVTCGDFGVDWYPISGLNSIHTALDALNYRLLFNELPASLIAQPELVPQLFRETAVDGLIVNLLPAFWEEPVSYFEAQPLPCIWLNLKRKLRSVYPDELGAGAMAAQWLMRRRYRRIGYISPLFAVQHHYSVLDRYNGVIGALEKAGLPVHRQWGPLGDQSAAVGPARERASAFLQEFPDVEAVICYEHEEAICLTVAAERMGRRVPDDLQILGFHERDIVETSGLKLPTMVVPFRDAGREAVEMLMRILDSGDRDVPSVMVPYRPLADG